MASDLQAFFSWKRKILIQLQEFSDMLFIIKIHFFERRVHHEKVQTFPKQKCFLQGHSALLRCAKQAAFPTHK